MKKQLIIGAMLVGLVTTASAVPVNITIYDQISGNDSLRWAYRDNPANGPWVQSMEDQEVEPGSADTQPNDFEGFFYDSQTKSLGIVGGYDMANTHNPVGDLFIGKIENGLPIYGMPDARSTPLTAGAFGYQYAYRFDFSDLSKPQAILYALNNDTTLYEPNILPKQTWSNPFRFEETEATVVKILDLLWITGLSDTDVGFQGGSHNAAVIQGDVFGHGGYLLHLTMACGNDSLVGTGVPDGGLTLALLGLGVTGLALFRRRTH